MTGKRINCKAELGDEFYKLRTELNLNNDELLKLLLANYRNKNKVDLKDIFSLDDNEKIEVNNAINSSNDTLEDIVKAGTLQRSRYLNSIANNDINFENLSDAELKQKPVKGAAEYRINKIIDRLKDHNDMQGEKKNKICLTRGIVFKLTGSNRKKINNFFDKYHVMIDDHNQKHELTNMDNRKGKNFNWNNLLGDE